MNRSACEHVINALQVTADRLLYQQDTIKETWAHLWRVIDFIKSQIPPGDKTDEHRGEGATK